MALYVEPVMQVVIFVPPDYATAVLAALARHRGLIRSSECREGTQVFRARVPHAEVGGFASTLFRITDGRASTSMVLEYWPVARPPSGEPEAGVREPRPRLPVLRSGAIAVPEPDDDGL
jgi:elongation factor G